jgi:hypothetical protein
VGGLQKLLCREQLLSGVGENAYCRAEVRGAIAHWDVHLRKAWAPQRDASGAIYKFKNSNMKTSLKIKKNKPYPEIYI